MQEYLVALLQQDVVYENRAVIVQNFDILQGCSFKMRFTSEL
jgi:hypothetical protein